MNSAATYAVLDCGSNSFHLVVAEKTGAGTFNIVYRRREVVRLAEFGSTIPASKILFAAETIAAMRKAAESYGAPLRVVATSAVREATNCEEVLQTIRDVTGTSVEVINGPAEAKYMYRACTATLGNSSKKVFCFDIGGGSTELAIGTGSEVHLSSSVQLGAVRLSKLFFHDSTLAHDAITKCRAHIATHLEIVLNEIRRHGFDDAVGTAGTLMSLIQVRIGKELGYGELIHGSILTAEDLDAVATVILGTKKIEQRREIPGLEEKRADIIPAGLLILEHIVKSLGLRQITYSHAGLREGVLLEMMDNPE